MSESDKSEVEKLLEQQKKEVDLRKNIAEAEKAIAEAEKAKLAAQFPSGAAKPLEGKITADEKFGYIAELTAYDAMMKMADTIAVKINNLNLGKASLLIVDSLDFFGPDAQLLQISSQLDSWKEALEDQNKEVHSLIPVERDILPAGVQAAPLGIAAALPMVSGILSTMADIVGYFRIDYDVKGRTINLSATALQFRVAGKINKHAVHLLHFHRLNSSPVIDDFNQCLRQRNNLLSNLAQLKSQVIDPAPAQITAFKGEIQTLEVELQKVNPAQNDPQSANLKNTLVKKQTDLSIVETAKGQADTAYTRAENLIKLFDEFNQLLTSVPEGKNYSPLTAAAIQKHLDELNITHLLYLTVISSGGDTIIGKGLFQSGRVRFLGGGVVSYVLVESTGKIVAADSIAGSSNVKVRLNQDNPPVFQAWTDKSS